MAKSSASVVQTLVHWVSSNNVSEQLKVAEVSRTDRHPTTAKYVNGSEY